METDVRQQADTIRFGDGGRNENNVYVQNDDEFCLAVIRDGDGKEAEIESVNVDNLIEALKEFKRRVKKSAVNINVVNESPAGLAIKQGKFDSAFRRFFDVCATNGQSPGWIRHDGAECPVHPMDVLKIRTTLGTAFGFHVANSNNWNVVTHYRPLRDSDGIPYCSAESLEPWAEYVATGKNRNIEQHAGKPVAGGYNICLD